MRTIPIAEIVIEERQRKKFDEGYLSALGGSIMDKGLMHPIVLRKKDDKLVLVAGERRLRAIIYLHSHDVFFSCDGEVTPPGEIPYVMLEDLSEADAMEAELEENLFRVDLSWQERQAALAGIHALREGLDPSQTIMDTAREIAEKTDRSIDATRRDVKRAEFLEQFMDDPEVAAAGSMNEAYKVASRKLEASFAAGLAAHEDQTNPDFILHEGDLTNILPTLAAGTVDIIIADPPYGMGADTFGDAAKLSHHYDDSAATGLFLNESIIREGFRIAKEQAHLFIFCDFQHFTYLSKTAADYGWMPWRTPIIWAKGVMGHAPIPDLGPRRCYEMILYANKGKRKMPLVVPDVINISALRDKDHAAQKPHVLYNTLLRWSAIPGETVLDPCCGRGTVFLSAKDLRMKAIGIEQDPASINLSKEAILL